MNTEKIEALKSLCEKVDVSEVEYCNYVVGDVLYQIRGTEMELSVMIFCFVIACIIAVVGFLS